MMKKRGQITLFMIIGIVLLFSTSLIFYMKEKVQEAGIDAESFKVEKVPQDIKPVKLFVENCLRQVGEDGVRILGANGGYIDIKSQGFKINPYSLDSEVVVMEPDYIPFWYYTDEADQFRSKMPAMYKTAEGDNSVEDQIETYIEGKIGGCIRNFSVFKQSYDIGEGDITAIATITEENVMLRLIYPLEIKSKLTNEKTKVSKFLTFLDLNFKEVFEFVNETIQLEINKTFLEKPMKTLINIYQGRDGPIPPFGEMALDAKMNVWTRIGVEEIIKNELLPMMQLIQIINTRDPRPAQVPDTGQKYHPEMQGLYNSFSLMMDKNHSTLNAGFFYPGTPIYFNIEGKEVIMPVNILPESPVLNLILPQLYEYPTDYDLSYPLVMLIDSPESFFGEGYRFQVALEGNIRNGLPYTPTDGFSMEQKRVVPKLKVSTPYLFVNKEITVETKDRREGEPLEGVRIYYKCGEKVAMGETKIEEDKAVIKVKFPSCAFGGKIIAEKEGYMGGAIRFNNNENNDDTFEFLLYPVVKKRFNIRKRNNTHIAALTGVLMSPPERVKKLKEEAARVDKQERVIFNIAKIKESDTEENFPMIGFFDYKMPDFIDPEVSATTDISTESQMEDIRNMDCGDNMTQEECDELKTSILESLEERDELAEQGGDGVGIIPGYYEVDLVPGKYKVSSQIIYKGNISIAEKPLKEVCSDDDECSYACKKEYDKDITGCDDDEGCCIEPMVMEMWIRGGAEVNITLSEKMVYSDKNLSFYVLDFGVPSTYDDMENSADIMAESEKYADLLGATFLTDEED